MLEPRGKGIVLWTLRYGDEVRDEDLYFARIGNEKAGSDALPLIEKFIKSKHEIGAPTWFTIQCRNASST